MIKKIQHLYPFHPTTTMKDCARSTHVINLLRGMRCSLSGLFTSDHIFLFIFFYALRRWFPPFHLAVFLFIHFFFISSLGRPPFSWNTKIIFLTRRYKKRTLTAFVGYGNFVISPRFHFFFRNSFFLCTTTYCLNNTICITSKKSLSFRVRNTSSYARQHDYVSQCILSTAVHDLAWC